ncbi:hypothetical protein FHT36_000354 [Xanthobacter sp. SG618]|uniref:hypothetical protein n=1 Tax=Xanthobacter sp. SG618 TaxID=2587121 RepID=UPI00145F64B5|nr:hypothetical protein [Xanthobacter sp. SG618]NMN56476.1 hypothetical protein [Xanthobacter sp. SG618]
MARTETAALILQLVDQISGPAKTAAKALTGLEKELADLRAKASKIDEFKNASRALDQASLAFKRSKDEVARLKAEMANVASPTRQMQQALSQAQRAADRAKQSFMEQGRAARQAAKDLSAAGIAKNQIAATEATLARQLDATTAAMRRQAAEAKKNHTASMQRAREASRSGGMGVGQAGLIGGFVGGAVGAGVAMVGHQVVRAGEATAERADEIATARNAFRASGASPAEIARADRLAAEVATRNPGVSRGKVLEWLRENRGYTGGDAGKERDLAHTLARGDMALRASGLKDGLSPFDALNVAKTVEGTGRAGDPEAMRKWLDFFVKAKQTFGTQFDSSAMRDFVANAKSAGLALSDDELQKRFIRTTTGNASRVGNETAQTLNSIGGGKMTPQSANWLANQGIIRREQIKKGAGGKFFLDGSVRGADLLATDPTEWAMSVLKPALDKNGAVSHERVKARMEEFRASTLRTDPNAKIDEHALEERALHSLYAQALQNSGFRSTVVDDLAHSLANSSLIERDQRNLNNAAGLNAAATVGQAPGAALAEFTNAVTEFAGVVASPAVAKAGEALHSLAGSIAGATAWLEGWRNGKSEDPTKPGSNAVTVPRTGAARLGFRNTGATDTILPQTGAARLGWRPQGQAAGQEAGAATGQGMAKGLAGEAPAVQSEMQQIMNILRQQGAQGVWVPVHPQAAPSGPSEAAPVEKPLGEGGIGHRAAGGPVDAYSPYYVGERGPELFVPDQAGKIIPNHQLGGDAPPVGRTVTMSPTFHVRGGNTDEVVQKVVAHLERMYQEASRGLLGDYGLDTA